MKLLLPKQMLLFLLFCKVPRLNCSSLSSLFLNSATRPYLSSSSGQSIYASHPCTLRFVVVDQLGAPGTDHELLVFESRCVGERKDHEETEGEVMVTLKK
jgi:hypothetical protein